MYIFIFIFFLLNLLAAVGYEPVFARLLGSWSDRSLGILWTVTTVGSFTAFFTMPSIMVELIIGATIYLLVGFILYLRGCIQYNNENNNW